MLLLAALTQTGSPDAAPAAEPPEDIVDFLGRRAQCLRLGVGRDRAAPEPGTRYHRIWQRYACDRIGAEEELLRRRHAGDATYIAALNRNERRFNLGQIIVTSYELGGPALEAMELRARDVERQRGIRLNFDTTAEAGRATRISASVDGAPLGEVLLDNRRFEYIDIRTALPFFTPVGGLGISLRYGDPQPWCFVNDDGRPTLDIDFRDGRPSASRLRYINCVGEREEIPPEELRPIRD